MRSFKRLLALSGLTGLLLALALSAPAQANVKISCVIDGQVKVTGKDGSPNYVQLTGGQGNFTFSSLTLVCVGADTKDKGDMPVKVFTGAVATTGKFVNTICGTGKVYGNITSKTGGPAKLQALVGDKFAIELLNFEGPLYWHDGYKGLGNELLKPFDDNPPGKPNPDGTKDYFLGGWVQLLPPSNKQPFELPDPLINKCTKAFDLVGVVDIDEDGM